MKFFKYISNIFLFLSIILISLKLITDDNVSNQKHSILGNINAPNVLIEYASLSCVHCANFHNDRLPDIKKALIDTGKLKYIYKDFPLDLPAMLASMVAKCYQDNQYYEVLNSLFKNQKKWVTSAKNKEELYQKFHKILKQHGITFDKIVSCTEESDANKVKWETILASRLEGQNLGVNSTPSFFLNGKKLEGLVNLDLLLKHIY